MAYLMLGPLKVWVAVRQLVYDIYIMILITILIIIIIITTIITINNSTNKN